MHLTLEEAFPRLELGSEFQKYLLDYTAAEVLVTGRIFISYRRGDGQAAAGRLYDRLLQHFNRDQLFIDVDAIEPGVDFVKSLDEQVANCIAFVAVIGPGWLTARTSDGNLRLDSPTDYVRVEIESALKRDIRVIPVLVDGASMPQPSDLPPSLRPLTRRNAREIAHHRFAADCDDLARHIKRALEAVTIPSVPEQTTIRRSIPSGEAGAKMSWLQILFSFKGRISRKQFLIGLSLIVAVGIAAAVALIETVDVIFEGQADQTEAVKKLSERLQDRLAIVFFTYLWWPSWALTLKRLHDIGHGWMTFSGFVALDVASFILTLMDQTQISDPLDYFGLGLMFMLAAIKGMDGPNSYGPDPFGTKQSSH